MLLRMHYMKLFFERCTTSWPSFIRFLIGQEYVDSIGGQVKDFYTLALQDRDALNKHMVCKMKRRGSCTGGRDREKECVTVTCKCHNSFQRRETSKGFSSISET
jgi:hypothetical protein